jgi:uroporphyrinogen decarboxylase
MSGMTPRECVLTALNREVPDRIPFELSYGSFTPALMETFVAETGAEDPAEFWNYPIRSVMHRQAPAFRLWRTYSCYYADYLLPGATISPFGVVHTLGSTEHFTRKIHPLRRAATVEEAADYPLPDPLDPARYAHLGNAVAALHARDLAVQGELYTTIFETSWAIRGLEETLTDLILNPGIIETLFDRLTDLRVVEARQLAEANVDVLRLGDDVAGQNGMLMRPATWRRWLKPRLAQIIQAAMTVKPELHIFYHCDGDCQAIIPDLIEIGVTVLNPVQPECMDAPQLKARYGDRLAFWGTIGTQTTMPFGTPEQVHAVVRERIETVGKGGGLVLAPTHVLEPEVPWRNVVAFVRAVKEFGVYER